MFTDYFFDIDIVGVTIAVPRALSFTNKPVPTRGRLLILFPSHELAKEILHFLKKKTPTLLRTRCIVLGEAPLDILFGSFLGPSILAILSTSPN